jgi:hypothetical protein
MATPDKNKSAAINVGKTVNAGFQGGRQEGAKAAGLASADTSTTYPDSASKPAEKPAETSLEKPAETPAESLGEKPADGAAETAAEKEAAEQKRGQTAQMPHCAIWRDPSTKRVTAALIHPRGGEYLVTGRGLGGTTGELLDLGYPIGAVRVDGPIWVMKRVPAGVEILGFANIQGFPLPTPDAPSKPST